VRQFHAGGGGGEPKIKYLSKENAISYGELAQV